MTPEELVVEGRRLFAESAEVRAALGQTIAGRPLVVLAGLVPGLCDELERCLGGMRQINAERAAVRAELDELVRRLRNVDLLGLNAWLEEHDR